MTHTPKNTNPVSAVVQGAARPNFGSVNIRGRGRLPHWEKEAGLYLLTFRLADSLPQTVLAKIVERRRVLQAAKRSGRKLLPHEESIVADFSTKKIEEYLDSGMGACHLRDPRVAELVVNTLRIWDGQRYRLIAWCLMPNHVHVVVRLFAGQSLSSLMRSWKTYTARTANKILSRSGEFWQREYYDHLIRDGGELERAIEYVRRNPERAGLNDWQWIWCADVDVRTTAGREAGAT
jgi:REP element-mobilizing transposase RayT